MGKENKKGSRRRGSQAFQFEQSEETLQQNETICNLYQNKNYVPPDPGELEAIVEESNQEETLGGRARRAVDSQTVFAIGVKKEKRIIEPYKYWRVDNKEKNKKRKIMTAKLWKGRKRPKLYSLTAEEEVFLSELIAAEDGDEECADEERCVWGQGVGHFDISSTSVSNDGPCLWGALEQEVPTSNTVANVTLNSQSPQRLESSPQKRPAVGDGEISKKLRIFDGREKRQEKREARKRKQENIQETDGETDVDQSEVDVDSTRLTEQGNQPPEKRNATLESGESASEDHNSTAQIETASSKKSLQRDPSSYLASLDISLTALIPAEELEEMMSEDFLFCGGTTSKGRRDHGDKTETEVNKIGATKSREGEESSTRRRRESTTTSRRRSARLSVHPNLTGSIFVEQEQPSTSPAQQNVAEVSRNTETILPVVSTAIPASPTHTITPNISAKSPDVNINTTPTMASPKLPKSSTATPLFNNSIAPLRVVIKGKTKSRLGKEVQQVLGDLTNFETKEGRLLKERTVSRVKGMTKGIPLLENSPTKKEKQGVDKKDMAIKSKEFSKKHQVVESKSKEDRPRSGEGSRRSSGLAGADLPLPESARRSITGEFVPQRSLNCSPAFQSHQGDSDSEEEVISGIFGKKTFGPMKMKEGSIDNAFLST